MVLPVIRKIGETHSALADLAGSVERGQPLTVLSLRGPHSDCEPWLLLPVMNGGRTYNPSWAP
jgi:hypothetical protein